MRFYGAEYNNIELGECILSINTIPWNKINEGPNISPNIETAYLVRSHEERWDRVFYKMLSE
jgi:hypothetical protein